MSTFKSLFTSSLSRQSFTNQESSLLVVASSSTAAATSSNSSTSQSQVSPSHNQSNHSYCRQQQQQQQNQQRNSIHLSSLLPHSPPPTPSSVMIPLTPTTGNYSATTANSPITDSTASPVTPVSNSINLYDGSCDIFMYEEDEFTSSSSAAVAATTTTNDTTTTTTCIDAAAASTVYLPEAGEIESAAAASAAAAEATVRVSKSITNITRDVMASSHITSESDTACMPIAMAAPCSPGRGNSSFLLHRDHLVSPVTTGGYHLSSFSSQNLNSHDKFKSTEYKENLAVNSQQSQSYENLPCNDQMAVDHQLYDLMVNYGEVTPSLSYHQPQVAHNLHSQQYQSNHLPSNMTSQQQHRSHTNYDVPYPTSMPMYISSNSASSTSYSSTNINSTSHMLSYINHCSTHAKTISPSPTPPPAPPVTGASCTSPSILSSIGKLSCTLLQTNDR